MLSERTGTRYSRRTFLRTGSQAAAGLLLVGCGPSNKQPETRNQAGRTPADSETQQEQPLATATEATRTERGVSVTASIALAESPTNWDLTGSLRNTPVVVPVEGGVYYRNKEGEVVLGEVSESRSASYLLWSLGNAGAPLAADEEAVYVLREGDLRLFKFSRVDNKHEEVWQALYAPEHLSSLGRSDFYRWPGRFTGNALALSGRDEQGRQRISLIDKDSGKLIKDVPDVGIRLAYKNTLLTSLGRLVDSSTGEFLVSQDTKTYIPTEKDAIFTYNVGSGPKELAIWDVEQKQQRARLTLPQTDLWYYPFGATENFALLSQEGGQERKILRVNLSSGETKELPYDAIIPAADAYGIHQEGDVFYLYNRQEGRLAAIDLATLTEVWQNTNFIAKMAQTFLLGKTDNVQVFLNTGQNPEVAFIDNQGKLVRRISMEDYLKSETQPPLVENGIFMAFASGKAKLIFLDTFEEEELELGFDGRGVTVFAKTAGDNAFIQDHNDLLHVVQIQGLKP